MNQTQLNDLIQKKDVAKIILQINSVKDLEDYFPIHCFHDLKFIVDQLYPKLDVTDFVNYVTSHYDEDPKNMNIVLGMLMSKGFKYDNINKNKFWALYGKYDKNHMIQYIKTKEELKNVIIIINIIDIQILELMINNNWNLFNFIIEKRIGIVSYDLRNYAKLVPIEFLLYSVKDKDIDKKTLMDIIVDKDVIDHVIKNCYLKVIDIVFNHKTEYAEYLIDKMIEIGSCEYKPITNHFPEYDAYNSDCYDIEIKGTKLSEKFLLFCENYRFINVNILSKYKKGRTLIYRFNFKNSTKYTPYYIRQNFYNGEMDYLDDFEDELQKEIVEEALRIKSKIPYEYYYRFFTDDDNKGVYPLRKNKRLQDENEKYYASWGSIAKFGYNLLARDKMDEKSMVKYI